MVIWKGGRGVKAPYETTHLRVPLPLKEQIERLIEQYKLSVIEGIEPESDHKLSFEEAKELSKKLLKSKTKNVESHAKLLTGIYGVDVTANDLIDK